MNFHVTGPWPLDRVRVLRAWLGERMIPVITSTTATLAYVTWSRTHYMRQLHGGDFEQYVSPDNARATLHELRLFLVSHPDDALWLDPYIDAIAAAFHDHKKRRHDADREAQIERQLAAGRDRPTVRVARGLRPTD